MEEKSKTEAVVRGIRRKTRRKYSAEEKIRIALEGLRGEESIVALCRREGIVPNIYCKWSKDFLEAGKKRLQGEFLLTSYCPPVFKFTHLWVYIYRLLLLLQASQSILTSPRPGGFSDNLQT